MKKGFTLIELLIVMSIIGLLAALAIFASQGARQQGRDAKRKSDLELIRSKLETYRSDCNRYPNSVTFGGALNGSGTPSSCSASTVYIERVPTDPQDPTVRYSYISASPYNTYQLCTRLEISPNPAMAMGTCGSSCGGTCNYRVTSP